MRRVKSTDVGQPEKQGNFEHVQSVVDAYLDDDSCSEHANGDDEGARGLAESTIPSVRILKLAQNVLKAPTMAVCAHAPCTTVRKCKSPTRCRTWPLGEWLPLKQYVTCPKFCEYHKRWHVLFHRVLIILVKVAHGVGHQ